MPNPTSEEDFHANQILRLSQIQSRVLGNLKETHSNFTEVYVTVDGMLKVNWRCNICGPQSKLLKRKSDVVRHIPTQTGMFNL